MEAWEEQEPQTLAPGQSPRLDFSPSRGGENPPGPCDLGYDHLAGLGSVGGPDSRALSPPVANRAVVQAPEITASPRHSAVATRAHGEELDARTLFGRSAGPKAAGSERRPFALGL